MKRLRPILLSGGAMLLLFVTTACRPTYEVTHIIGERIAVDSVWDATPDTDAINLLSPYIAKTRGLMQEVIGTSALSMDRERPESPLSNLVADVLREAAVPYLGKPADMGLINIGGIRTPLNEGPITSLAIYEMLPFENNYCILTLKGSVLMQLFEEIALRGGEGVSGVRLRLAAGGKLKEATVGDKAVETERLYTVATIDYLAEGNDGMEACSRSESQLSPEGVTLRNLFIEYVEQQTAAGKKVTARMEGRIQ